MPVVRQNRQHVVLRALVAPDETVEPGQKKHSSTCECSDCDFHGTDCNCKRCREMRQGAAAQCVKQASPQHGLPGQCPYFCPCQSIKLSPNHARNGGDQQPNSNALTAYLAQAAQQTSNFMGYLANGRW